MQFKPTVIPDVILIEPKVFGDHRGFFLETYQAKRYAKAGIPNKFIQDNFYCDFAGSFKTYF